MALKQEESSLKDTIRSEDILVDNLKDVMETVEKLMNPTQGYSLGQIGAIFRNLQVIFWPKKTN